MSTSLLSIQTFNDSVVLVAEYCIDCGVDKHCSDVTSAVTNFRCHELIANVNN